MNIQSLGSPVASRLEERSLPALEQQNAQPAKAVQAAGAPEAAQPSREELTDAVRQIPSVEALEIAKSIDKMRGLLISQTA